MRRAIRIAFATVFLTAFVATLAYAQNFKKQVIYQIVTDRFYNGDTTNDNPPQSSGLFDSTQTNWNFYWVGDLAGIQAKLGNTDSQQAKGEAPAAAGALRQCLQEGFRVIRT